MDHEQQQKYKCAVCSYKTVALSGYIIGDIYAKCTVCNCIFYNKYEYIGDNIKCPLDAKQSKECEICNSTRNDTVLRWNKYRNNEILLCCDKCYI